MFNVVRYCRTQQSGVDCGADAKYGYERFKPLACQEHMSQDMTDVVTILCKTCNIASMSRVYKPYCANCYFYHHPEDPRNRNFKTKEQAFMFGVKRIYPNIILDKTVQGGCSNRRPDGRIECSTHSVIVEVDELQHQSYDATCEHRRVMELFESLGSRPIVFVRINPDAYTCDGKIIKGVFSTSKLTGSLKLNKKMFDIRFEQLELAIAEAVETIPTKAVQTVKLFYSDQ